VPPDHSTYARSPRDGGAHPSPKDLLLGSGPDNGNAPAPHDGTLKGLLVLSRGTAIILLGVYMFYLYFQVRAARARSALIIPAKLTGADATRQLKSHASLFEADAQAARTNENGEVEEEEKPEMDAYSAFGWLALVTVATAVCADVLVASIDETAAQWNLPKA
jgi:Ca2+:H+ antiporter